MTCASIVRAAVPQDEEGLWKLLRLMHEETGLYPLSETKVQFYLHRVLYPETISPDDNGPRGIIGVIGNDQLEGIIMLVLGSVWYSDAMSLQDMVSFVHPDYRHAGHARALIDYGKRMTDEVRKYDPDFRMMVGVVSSVRTAAKCRLYDQMLTPVGAFYLYPSPPDFIPIKEARRNLNHHERRVIDAAKRMAKY
jgi:GNAT superfamily N-acetyltransferase